MAADRQSSLFEAERKLLLLAHSSRSARSWNIQQVLKNPTHCEPAQQIARSFDAWIEKLWEQNGDGRRIASRLQVQIAVLSVLSQHPCVYLNNSKGLSATLASCFLRASGIPAFDNACARAVQAMERGESLEGELPLTAAEQEALACMERVRDTLFQESFIDQGSVLAYLSARRNEVFLQPLNVRFVDDAPLTAQQVAFFAACEDVCALETNPRTAQLREHIEGLEVRMALSSGAYAQPQLILNAIHDMLAEHPDSSVIITCKDQERLFRLIGPALAQAGISCAVQSSRTFVDTDFGRAYLLAHTIEDAHRPVDATVFSDLLLSPLCGIKKETVWRFNRAVRTNRLMTSREVRELLQGKGDILQCMLAGDFLNPAFEARFRQLLDQGVSPVYVREQQAAYYALRDALETAQRFDIVDEQALLALIENMSFPFSCEYEIDDWTSAACSVRAEYDGSDAGVTEQLDGAHDGRNETAGRIAQVRIMSQRSACELASGSIDLLIMCDLTTESYPLEEEHSAVRTLLHALGIDEPGTVLERERQTFDALVRLPSQRLVLERSMNDEKADPLYPSAMLEEFISLHADDPMVQQLFYMQGEDGLVNDMHPVYPGLELPLERITVHERDYLGDDLDLVAPHSANQIHPELPRLSPSQIEAYLDCPYKWFVQSRLGMDTLDEELGSRERGSFLHSVFQRFYMGFGKKVTKQNLPEARIFMFGPDGTSGIFAEVVREQYEPASNGKPLSNRFVPIPDSTEMLEFDYLKDRVRSWLEFETTFLPSYQPIAFEQSFKGVEFEGCELAGVVDRIDRDDEGHVVVIDYKGSLSKDYCALKKDTLNEQGKIQTLLYALLLDQLDDLSISTSDVVGALYVSYDAGNAVEGAYNRNHLGVAEIPTVNYAKECGLSGEPPLDLQTLLDVTAHRIAQVVDGIKKGEIAPDPRSEDSCKYCPVLSCEKRIS